MYFKDFQNIFYDYDITHQVGSGTQAKGIASVSGGIVTSVAITDGGTGYSDALISFTAPQIEPGVTATARAIVSSGNITQIVMINGGVGYSTAPTVIISTPWKTLPTTTKSFIVKDITRNIRFRRDILANIAVYDEYDIIDGETPEIVAERIYGNPEYHWIVMLANDRYDYRNDWPLTYNNLQQYITDKYGSAANNVHHYENSNGLTVDSDYPSAVPITNANYEEQVNEAKRRIKLIAPSLISTVLRNFKDQM
jgi:hypothetical protein